MSDRLTELLPWYANGTLDAEDRAWVDAYLAEHPEARGELEWYQSLHTQMRAAEPEVSDEIGLDRVLNKIRVENTEIARAERERQSAAPATAAPAGRRAPSAEAGLGERLRRWIGSFGMRPALALALAVIAVQSVLLMKPDLGGDSEIRAIRRTAPAASGPLIKVNFKSTATEADIRLLLVRVQGSLAGGPGQLGDWYVRVPADRVQQAVATLGAAPIVEATALVDALPAQN